MEEQSRAWWPLTYEEATPEQIAEARAWARRTLAETKARHTPEYFANLRARLGWPVVES